MEKIKIKLNIDKLRVVCDLVDSSMNQTNIPTPAYKMVKSIAEEVQERLLKKSITERNNVKSFNISMKYYEAYALESLLRVNLNGINENAIYEQNVIRSLADEIRIML